MSEGVKRERRLACGLCLERALFWNAREDTTYATYLGINNALTTLENT